MDLRAMLNNESTTTSTQQRPSLQTDTPRHSYTSYPDPSRNEFSPPAYPSTSRDRPPNPPPIHTQDPRSPSGSSARTSIQSPYQHTSASTSSLSGGPGGYHSPGHVVTNSHYVPHTGASSYNNGGFVPSPGQFVPQPTTPAQQSILSDHHRPQSSHSGTPSSPSYLHTYAPRDSPGQFHASQQISQARQISPYAQQSSQPGTPLGPPAPYQRPSPKVNRQHSDYDHTRTLSMGSHTSNPTSEHVHQNTTPESSARDAQTKQYSFERERERSQSVSPKTIIQPYVARQRLTESPQNERMALKSRSQDRMMSGQRNDISSSGLSVDRSETPGLPGHQPTPSTSQTSSAYQSPIPASGTLQTPKSRLAQLPGAQLPSAPYVASLKRDSSAISGSSVSPQPRARKRLRYEEIPVFARSARVVPTKAKSGIQGPPPEQTVKITGKPSNGPVQRQETNGNDVESHMEEPNLGLTNLRWEPSIVNTIPFEDLTRLMCDQIFFKIGMEEPPAENAKFEIEAKLGEIQLADERTRINLPVLTECLIDKATVSLPKTLFKSSMTPDQHKHLNVFLNECLLKSKHPDREEIFYKHTKEIDNFYDLSPEGKVKLPDSIQGYLRPMHKPKVRITTDLQTGSIVAQIIKIRIVDFDIYNPRTPFDYRISVSLECPWQGTKNDLILLNEEMGRRGDREKDRMSYRHLAYQIDLTQVSYPQTSLKEHELEIEVSPDALRQEIQYARSQRPNRYEDLVRGFVDNVRLLSRHVPTAAR